MYLKACFVAYTKYISYSKYESKPNYRCCRDNPDAVDVVHKLATKKIIYGLVEAVEGCNKLLKNLHTFVYIFSDAYAIKAFRTTTFGTLQFRIVYYLIAISKPSKFPLFSLQVLKKIRPVKNVGNCHFKLRL